jgi:transcription termination factor Rho
MLLPELQTMASSLGIPGTGRLRKGQLIAAIQNAQQAGDGPSSPNGSAANGEYVVADAMPATESAAAPTTAAPPRTRGRRVVRATGSPEQAELVPAPARDAEAEAAPISTGRASRSSRSARTEARTDTRTEARIDARTDARAEESPAPAAAREENAAPRAREDRRERPERADRTERADRPERTDRPERGERTQGERHERANGRQNARQNDRGADRSDRSDRPDRSDRSDRPDRSDRSDRPDRQTDRQSDRQGNRVTQDDDDENGRRRGRFRERGRNRRGQGGPTDSNEPVLREDDVLVPVAGILDVLDNYAFVRTSGYLTGPADVYVSLAQVRRHGLRRGDAITGVVRAPQEGEARRDKYNALVRLDTINGMDPEDARGRPEFTKLTPLYPQDRLRMETEPHVLTTRVIDLVMPIGKGQRALIVSPPKAGKTMVLQAIANAITTNNPEVHLMVVLVDERPEEVTDMQRSVKGEVIASTFDRPPGDHTNVAELSIERAKRLVELGQDVVVLLDSITRLGRAYNLAAPASGRILSGGVDSTALYPPKRFLGAARNIENGGSLTIIATALVETGSTMDTVIFEEFKGTGNAELKLDRKIADKRVFPAVDVDSSSTRKEEILLAPDELAIMHKLRRVLHTREPQQAIELLMGQLKQTRTNYEFLMQIAKSTPSQD